MITVLMTVCTKERAIIYNLKTFYVVPVSEISASSEKISSFDCKLCNIMSESRGDIISWGLVSATDIGADNEITAF